MRLEPPLQPLIGEELRERSAITTDEARCDVSARGFWSAGHVAFLDVSLFNPNANRYVDQSLKKTYEINEKEKKRACNERVQEIDSSRFVHPYCNVCNRRMARECSKFYSRLSKMIAEKRDQSYSVIASWIRRKISFSLIRSIGMCIRGSRSVTSSNDLLKSTANDVVASEAISNIVSV